MTSLVCPHCDSAFDTDKRVVRAEITECKLCQQKFVVTQGTLKSHKKAVPEQKQSVQPEENPVKINCPHCSTALQGQISTGQIVECSQCHKQFEATPERLNNTVPVLSKTVVPTHGSTSQKPKSIAGKLFLIAIALVVIAPFIMPDSSDTKTTSTEPVAAPVQPEPVVDPNAPENFLSGWDGSNKELVNLVKSGMNDPKSFEHVETRFIDNGDSLKLYMTFRGKNAFNATVTNKVSADLKKTTRTLSNIQEP